MVDLLKSTIISFETAHLQNTITMFDKDACDSVPKSVCVMLLIGLIFSICPQRAIAVDCAAKLYTLQTGSADSCTGGSTHAFPLDASCHGWSVADSSGRLQSNSASGMRCLNHGGFAFEHFSNSLTCTGTGVTKVRLYVASHGDYTGQL